MSKLLEFMALDKQRFLRVPHHLAPVAAILDQVGHVEVRALVQAPPGHGMSALFQAAMLQALGFGAGVAIVSQPHAAPVRSPRGGVFHPFSPMLGHRFDLVLLQDLFRRIPSPDQIDEMVLWLRTSVFMHMRPGASVIVDEPWLTEALLLDEDGRAADGWHVVRLPAVSAEGAPLAPSWYSAADLTGLRADVNGPIWDRCFQGEVLAMADELRGYRHLCEGCPVGAFPPPHMAERRAAIFARWPSAEQHLEQIEQRLGILSPLRAPRTTDEAIATTRIGFGNLVIEPTGSITIQREGRNRTVVVPAIFSMDVCNRLECACRDGELAILVLPIPGYTCVLARVVGVTHIVGASGSIVFVLDDADSATASTGLRWDQSTCDPAADLAAARTPR